MNYGRAIRTCRTVYGLTQSELAERLSIGASQLSLIESGKRAPSVKVLDEVSKALEVPPHLVTLLASDLRDIQNTKDKSEIADLAVALLRVLLSADEAQLPLPMKP